MKKIFIFALIIIALLTSVCWFFSVQSKVDQSRISVATHSDDKNNRLPLGDGKISTAPKKGFIMLCPVRLTGSGYFREGAWIYDDGTWDPSQKIEVAGDAAWGNHRYEIRLAGNKRQLLGNGLPNHRTGIFPIRQTDDAYNYDRNPNSINEYALVFELPALPALAEKPSCLPMGAVGVMKTGAAIFNGLDAGGKDAVAHEIQDKCNGHPEPDGHYHYHNLSKCIEENANVGHSELVGYALDGFGIFGKYGENGSELTNKDLDECHGHIHEILWDGRKVVMYHYHATREYPYTIGCFKGASITK